VYDVSNHRYFQILVVLCDEDKKMVVATSLDHVAELVNEGNIRPIQLAASEVYEVIKRENVGLMFTVTHNIYVLLLSIVVYC
jgi:hypothetical protein